MLLVISRESETQHQSSRTSKRNFRHSNESGGYLNGRFNVPEEQENGSCNHDSLFVALPSEEYISRTEI